MQMSVAVSMRKVIHSTVRNEGILGFYKGMGPPLITVPFINSIVYASFELCKNFMNVASEKEFTFYQALIAGMFAGLSNSVVVGPIELVKCRL